MRAVEATDEQIALNESTFRDVNEAIEAGRRDREGFVPFVCECGRLGCTSVIELTLREYEDVRAESRWFLVLPGHENEFEEHRLEDPRYTVVAKPDGPHGDIADETDPRRDPG